MSDFATARRSMVNSQVRVNDVTDYRIQDAMLDLPRERFLPRSKQAKAYSDTEVEITDGRFLICARDMSKLIQVADIKSDDLVLDIACGRGYSTAVLSRLCETVVGLESDEGLVDCATETLSELSADNAVVVKGSLTDGVPDQGPFNVIVIAGAVDEVPAKLFDQLDEGGRLVTFIRKGDAGEATVFTKSGHSVGNRAIFDGTPTLVPGFEKSAGFVF